uniref:Amino acid transporter transmembrane domain-containing protein n=1 Tax=Parascaris univalens TaxID=6257 RepID=A0A914ZKM8_PARUN
MVANDEKEAKHQNKKGLGWFVTALFVMGDIAGGGIVALPGAMIQMDFYPGLVLAVIMTFVTMYTSVLLGEGWVILQRRWPQYREHCRKPYSEMGARAMGNVAKNMVSTCIAVTQFGTAVVFLLLSAKNIGDFLKAFFSVNFSYCYLIVIVGVGLLPLTFLKSPQDFWWAVVAAMVTTTAALLLVIIGAGLDYSTCAPDRGVNDKLVITNYFLGLGTLLFSYGGHSAFPTIVHDMRKPYHFNRSSVFAFAAVACMYIPVSIMGFVTYGNSVQDSIINSIQIKGIQQAINILITLHCILALTIIFNPLNQEIEEILRVPQRFGWQRAAVRTSVMIAVIFVAESLPTFGPLLNIVGGSTLTLTSLVFPALFYLYLAAGEKKWLQQKIGSDKPPTFMEVVTESPKIRLAACGFVIVFGLLGGASATFSAIRELATTKFAIPCYVQPFLHANGTEDDKTSLNCCGKEMLMRKKLKKAKGVMRDKTSTVRFKLQLTSYDFVGIPVIPPALTYASGCALLVPNFQKLVPCF